MDLSCFTADIEGLHYYGANHYNITQDRTGYNVYVNVLDDDGNAICGAIYAASSLSTAIATIEYLEAGKAE